MGRPGPDGWTNSGSIQRCDMDGKNVTMVIALGTETHTPKQLVIAEKNRKLYWCDREGMRVMRCDLDVCVLENILWIFHKNGRLDRKIEETVLALAYLYSLKLSHSIKPHFFTKSW
jgi:hypothetical protein